MDDAEYSPIRPLIDWLDYNGYKVVTKPAKEFTNSMGRRKVKGKRGYRAGDGMSWRYRGFWENLDHVVLFSGDGDFRSLIAAVQAKGERRTSVISTGSTTRPPMVADELETPDRPVHRPRRPGGTRSDAIRPSARGSPSASEKKKKIFFFLKKKKKKK